MRFLTQLVLALIIATFSVSFGWWLRGHSSAPNIEVAIEEQVEAATNAAIVSTIGKSMADAKKNVRLYEENAENHYRQIEILMKESAAQSHRRNNATR